MRAVRFETNLHSSEMPEVDLPIEIRRGNAALVGRTVARQPVELDSGDYIAVTRLPNGQQIHTEFSVPEGLSDLDVQLTLDVMDLPRYEFLRFARGVAAKQLQGRHPLLFRSAAAMFRTLEEITLRPFGGNLLKSEAKLVPLEQWLVSSSDPQMLGRNFDIEGTGIQIVQVIRPNRNPLNILLPIVTTAQGRCRLMVYTASGESRVEACPQSSVADALLQFSLRNALDDESLLATESAKRLLVNPDHDPIEALVITYALLRLSNLNFLHDWIEKLYEWLPLSPDRAAIRAEYFARTNQHRKAIAELLSLRVLGLPIFTEGLSYSLDRLYFYSSLGDTPATAETLGLDALTLPEIRSLLADLQRFAIYVDFSQSMVIYPGLDPNSPEDEPITKGADHLGGQDISALLYRT